MFVLERFKAWNEEIPLKRMLKKCVIAATDTYVLKSQRWFETLINLLSL